ncbi:MAG: type III pantothenate kinase [Saprospiraceae bacterium]
MNLIIDIGNTRVKLAAFEGKEIQQKWLWPTLEEEKLLRLIKRKKIKQIALSSTRGTDKALLKRLSKVVPVLELSAKTPLPIINSYKTPKTLGKDRLAAVIAANDLFPNKNCLVIDAGTCITYDLITKAGEYLGGGISPGVDMRFKAMDTFTAKLPLVKRTKEIALIGNTTDTALRSGGALGAVFEVAGFIKAYRKEFSPLTVILTGGAADFFEAHLKTKIFVNHNLVLLGLNKILNHNGESK